MKNWQHLKISFAEIESATEKFKSCIGRGGYGWVYKGVLSINGKDTTVAVKRLNEQFGQGLKEFMTEIRLLSGQGHPNLVSLVGYCDEGKEKSLVYEFVERGSLDMYIRRGSKSTLTWMQRLKICADAARGLEYLHNHVGAHQTIIHRDIKSSNILIDENWAGKISDLGLSKLNATGLGMTLIVSNGCGTHGYCEPEYFNTGILTTKSDVYSFGIVLFEVLCGRLCLVDCDDGFILSGYTVTEYYKKDNMKRIIDPVLREQMSEYSMNRFLAIAYRCLHGNREQRPSMDVVKKELEETLKIQEEYEAKKNKKMSKGNVTPQPDSYWEAKLPQDWNVTMRKLKVSFPSNTTKKTLFRMLHNGISFEEGNKVFWINDDAKKCLLISAKTFLPLDSETYPKWVPHFYSRFPMVAEYNYKECHDISCQIKATILSLGTMYVASLIFKYCEQPDKDLDRLKLITIKWKMEELSVSSTHTAELIANNWYKIKMWHFINHGQNADFDIIIKELSYFEDPIESEILIQGIEFQPIEMMQHEEIERFNEISVLDEEEYWEAKLPNDYQRYLKMSDKPLHKKNNKNNNTKSRMHKVWGYFRVNLKLGRPFHNNKDKYLEKKLQNDSQHSVERPDNILQYTNKKELYFRFCEGFLGDNGQLWISLCKTTGGICSMLPATNILPDDYNYKRLDSVFLSESRFGEVKTLQEAHWYTFECRLQPHMFSPEYNYACYLVFKFEENYIQPDDSCFFKAWYNLDDTFGDTFFAHFNSSSVDIPTIKPNKDIGLDDSENITTNERVKMPKHNMDHLADSMINERNDGWMEVMLCKPLNKLQDHKSLRATLSKIKGGSFRGIIVEGVEFRPVQEYS